MGATWWIQLNLCFLWLTRVHSPNGKLIGSATSAQLTAESRAILYNRRPFPLKIAPSHGGSRPYLTDDSLDQSQPTIQTASRSGSAVFAQVTAECPYILQWASLSQKMPLLLGGSGSASGGSGPASNTISWAHLSPQPKRHLGWFSRFYTVSYFTMGWPFPTQNCPFPWGI